MSPLLLAIVCCLAVGSSCFEAPSRKSSGRLSLKTTLIAEHSRRTHRDDRLRAQEEPTSVEQLLPSILQRRERVSPTEAFDAAYASYESDEAAPSLNPNKNLFDTHHFDESYQTHSLCEAWNSGGHGDNVNLEWTESADRLLRIIGNGVVKDGYNMFMAPAQSHGQTTNISIAVYIESMSSFRAQTMDFEVDMYLATAWFDRRLAHNCTHPILVTHKFIADRIWQPDLYFVNSKFAYLQEVTTPNFMLIVYPDGLIFKSMRIDVTLSCMMDLKRFPMDVQECPMVIQSYAYVDNLVNLTWHVDPPNFPIGSNAEIKLNDMVITNTRYTRCSGPYPMFRGSGNWSCLCGFIVMKRLVLFHVIQTYIPTGMLVSISWMSFWLDPRASPARITLTITTLLTLTTMSNGARQDLPQVAYVKMLDLWLSFNQALIFLVLLEYAFVSYFLTRKNLNCEHKKVLSASASINNHMKTAPAERRLFRQDSPLTGMGAADRPIVNGNGVYLRQRHWSIDSGHHTTKAGINATAAALMAATSHQTAKNYETLAKPCTQCSYENELIARKIDHYSRIIFPSAFGVFCSTYWLYYSWWDLQQ